MTDEVNTEAQNTEANSTDADNGNQQESAKNIDEARAEKADLLFGGNDGDDSEKGKDDEDTEGKDSSESDEESSDKEKTDADKDDSEGAPEEYKDFAMPEGVELDKEASDELKTIAKELNLSQKDAQRLADLGVKQAAKFADQPAQILKEAQEEWTKQSRADEEFGGAKLDENLATARKALETYGNDSLKTLLRESGLGNHPEVLRFMYRAGKAISEDTIVTGKGGGDKSQSKSAADVLYG